jgi:molecular chaperone DnaK (HSP70)
MKPKHVAEYYLNQTVYEAVVTVPVHFNEDQRKATINAGAIAGLKVNRIISEPTVAALAYGLDKKGACFVVVYDIGGGTLDVSLLTMEEDYFQVLTTGGVTRLGGEDFDENCVQAMIGRFVKATGEDPSRRCEAAKIDLSTEAEAEAAIEIPAFFMSRDLKEVFTREQFNAANDDLFRKTLDTTSQVLEDAIRH